AARRSNRGPPRGARGRDTASVAVTPLVGPCTATAFSDASAEARRTPLAGGELHRATARDRRERGRPAHDAQGVNVAASCAGKAGGVSEGTSASRGVRVCYRGTRSPGQRGMRKDSWLS